MLEPSQLVSLLGQAGPAAPLAPTLGSKLVPLAMAVVVLAVTLEMIRRRKLREEYALLWMGASVVMVLVALFPKTVIWLQDHLQVNYLTIVVLALFLFLSMIVMHFAIVISKQSEDIRQLAQRMALMNSKIEELAPKSEKKPDDGVRS